MSKEQKEYIKKHRINKLIILGIQILIVCVFFLTWEILSKKEIINSFIFSSPSIIVNTIYEMSLGGELFKHIWVSVYETLIAFGIGLILSIGISTLLYLYNNLYRVLDPFLTCLNSLPKVALGPIIIVWAGAGMSAIIVMALAISLVVTILEILNGFLNTDKELIKMAQTFNANKFQILTKIIIPANKHTFFNSLKVNIGLSLVGVITGEFLVSKAGLGYLIVYGGQVFQLDLVMTSVIILAIVAWVMYESVVLLGKLAQRWQK